MAHSVMVTGADGFIGSHLTEELVKRGEKVLPVQFLRLAGLDRHPAAGDPQGDRHFHG